MALLVKENKASPPKIRLPDFQSGGSILSTLPEIRARQETLTQAPKEPLLKRILPTPIKEGLFGQGQVTAGLPGQEKQVFDMGFVGAFRPFGLGKPKEQKVFERLDLLAPLVGSGTITQDRADVIAKQSLAPTGFEKTKQELQGAQFPKIELTKVERRAVRPVVIEETLDKIFGALDLISLGTLKPIARTAAQRIAKSTVADEISKILLKEIPDLAGDTATTLGRILTQVDNADDVQTVLNRVEFSVKGAKGAPAEEVARPLLQEAKVAKDTGTITPSISQAKSSGQSFDEWVKGQPVKVYHSTSASNKETILREGFKKGSDLSEDAFRGGGHGAMQDSISFAETPKDASRFGISQKNTLIEAELKPNSKVIDRMDIEFAEELNDEIPKLLKENVDAVRIGSGEGEIVVINPKAIGKITDTFDFRGVEAKDIDKLFKPKGQTRSQLKAEWDGVSTQVPSQPQLSQMLPGGAGKQSNLLLAGTVQEAPRIVKSKDTPIKVLEDFPEDVISRETSIAQQNMIDERQFKQDFFDFEQTLKEIPDFLERKIISAEDLDFLREELDSLKSMLMGQGDERVENIIKYARPGFVDSVYYRNVDLPEITGRDPARPRKNISLFQREGDGILQEWGFSSQEQAQAEIDNYIRTKREIKSLRDSLREAIPIVKKFEKLKRQATKEEQKRISALIDEVRKTGRRLRKLTGAEIERTLRPEDRILKIKEGKLLRERFKQQIIGAKAGVRSTKNRNAQIRAIRDDFNLSDADLKRVAGGRDVRLMTQKDYESFLDRIGKLAELEAERLEAKTILKGTLLEKEFKNVGNLQKALEFPPIEKMTTEQLREFDKILQPFQKGDVFLSKRKLELIDRTDLKGVRTRREAEARLAQKLGVPVADLQKIRVNEFDRFRWDTPLAEKNAFYKFLVEGTNASFLEGDARFLEMERWVNEHMGKARKGQGLLGRIAPIDKKIFDYLESTDKDTLAKDMTPAQLEVAEYMRDRFSEALAYEYEMKVLKSSRYEDNYITHIRRGFFEALREGEVKNAFKELFDQYKQDEAVLNILDQKTDEILPLEKFFKFALQRTGGIVPTKNVASAFLAYMRVFERKRALDKIIPEIMAYVDVLTPQELTPKGLFKDDRLNSFTKEWLNTKKGRRTKLFVQPGGKADFVLRSVKALTNVLDLAVNIPLQIGSQGGVQAGLYTTIGAKRYSVGVLRLGTKRGRDLVKQFENFTGRSPWKQLLDASDGLPEKVYSTMFILFRDAIVRANKIHLLGSLTPQEWTSGVVNPQRLAELQTEAGRWLPIEGGKSILGATTEGSLATQYKTWAIPPLRTTVKNLADLIRMTKNKQNPFKSREFWELFRVAQITAVVSLVAYAVGNDADKKERDRTFTDKLINKALRDSMSMISAIDPKTYTSVPRTLTFMTDLMLGLSDLIRLEEYKASGADFKKGDLRGVVKLKRTLTPAIIKGSFKGGSQSTPSGIPKINI